MNITKIVIPLHHGGGKDGNDTELRYALRSINKYFKGKYKVQIIGRKIPDWLHGVELIETNADLKECVYLASKKNPKGFFWFYDDCCLTRKNSEEEMKITPCKSFNHTPDSVWGRWLKEIGANLSVEGIKAWDYSTPHGPYWYNYDIIQESRNDLGDIRGEMTNKKPFETWILSKLDWPRRMNCVDHLRKVIANSAVNIAEKDKDHLYYINYSDGNFTKETVKYLNNRFEVATRFEKDNGKDFIGLKYDTNIVKDQISKYCEEYNLDIDTACEVGVGLNSEIQNIKAKNKIYIEPNIEVFGMTQKRFEGSLCNAAIGLYETDGFFLKNKKNESSLDNDLVKMSLTKNAKKIDRKLTKDNQYIKCFPFVVFDNEKIDLLSINCEGQEFNVLESLISKPKIIQTKKTKHEKQIDLWLEKNNYKEINCLNGRYLYALK
jgi:hypothetical protein